MFNYGVIIEARQTSKRLPNKILNKINNIEGLILLIKRIQKSKKLQKIIISIPDNKNNNELKKLLIKKNIAFYKGKEEDVLDRIAKTANKFNLKNVIRLTSDNFLIDAKNLDKMIEYHKIVKGFVCNNYRKNSKKRITPYGVDIQIIENRILKNINNFIKLKKYREYPMNFMYNNLSNIKFNTFISDYKFNRMLEKSFTVDTINDFIKVKNIFEKYGNSVEVTKIK